MRIHRYTQWDGTQEVLFPTTDDLLKHLSDNLLEEEGVRRALRDLMRRGLTSEDGLRSVKGMRDFLREADEKRREMLKNSRPTTSKCGISWSVSRASTPATWTKCSAGCRRLISAIRN
jgi:uncharacterized protein with von Willebrand factor type A (vWA) domain